MAIVKDYMIGRTRIRIDDSCVVKTQEEVQQILDRLAVIYRPAVLAIQEMERLEKERLVGCE